MNHDFSGKIIRAISGFYSVQSGERVVECRGRGKLRRALLTPQVGDLVRCCASGEQGTVEEILPRRNSFVRPAVSNLDLLVIFASEVIPVTEPFLIDRVTAIAGWKNVPVLLCINKSDLKSGAGLAEIYRHAGFSVVCTSAQTGDGIEELWGLLRGKTVAFTGNSGVGKSSVLNRLCPALALKTGEVSQKLGRGRHTTRHVELYALGEQTYVADTPGFSSFDTEQLEPFEPSELQDAFTDFAPFVGKCQFHDCAHLKEPGCAVLQALHDGLLEPTRHNSYVRLYEQAKEAKQWGQKQP